MTLEVPRRPGQGVLFVPHAAERDSGREDARLSGSTLYYFDDDIGCWYSRDQRRCGDAGFTKERTYRTDKFVLFNSDDEGCQIGMRWSVSIREG